MDGRQSNLQDAVEEAFQKAEAKNKAESDSSSSVSSSDSSSESEGFGFCQKKKPKQRARPKAKAKPADTPSIAATTPATASAAETAPSAPSTPAPSAVKSERGNQNLCEKGAAMVDALKQVTTASLWSSPGRAKEIETRLGKCMDLVSRLEARVNDDQSLQLSASLTAEAERVHRLLDTIQLLHETGDWDTELVKSNDQIQEIFNTFKPEEAVQFVTDIAKKLVEARIKLFVFRLASNQTRKRN